MLAILGRQHQYSAPAHECPIPHTAKEVTIDMRSVSHEDRSIGDDQLRLRMRAHATGLRRTGRRERGSDRKDRALMLRRDSLASRFSSSAFTFGISAMLGYRLVLRIRDLPSRRPCVFNPAGTPKDASLLMASPGDPSWRTGPICFAALRRASGAPPVK